MRPTKTLLCALPLLVLTECSALIGQLNSKRELKTIDRNFANQLFCSIGKIVPVKFGMLNDDPAGLALRDLEIKRS